MRGGGEAAPRIEEVAARLGGRLRVVGPRPLAEVPIWMAACDLLALASWNEGTPNAVLEALACGRRVVATAVGGVPDLITSDTLGALVPAHQPDALAAALTQALRTPYAPEAVAEPGGPRCWEAGAAALPAVVD